MTYARRYDEAAQQLERLIALSPDSALGTFWYPGGLEVDGNNSVSRLPVQQNLTNYTKLNSYVCYPTWPALGNQIAFEYAKTTGNIWMANLR